MSSVIIHRPPVKAENFVVPVPKAVLVPSTEDSMPFNAAMKQEEPMDLSEYGYVEEEYFISGEANVYAYGPKRGDTTYIKAENCPYTNRILVRKPADPKNFSGIIVVEVMNNAFFMDNPQAGWGALHPYMLPRNIAWVGLTFRDHCFTTMKKYDPERYAPLYLPNPIPAEERGPLLGKAYGFKIDPDQENGLCFDILSQVAQLIRSGHEDSPFYGYDVRYLYATGATAGDMTTYAGFVHNYARQENGKTVYDGLQVYMTGAPSNLNNEEMNILGPDPMSVIDSVAPCFRVLTLGDMLGKGAHPDWSVLQRKDDEDDPVYRVYEISGAALGIRADNNFMMNKYDAERCGARFANMMPKRPYQHFPVQYMIRAAFVALRRYCEAGILPPKAERLQFTGSYPDMDFVLDENGNAKGGIRSSYVDVPIAAYSWDGVITPFSKEKLREMYGNHANYVKLVAENCMKHVKEGFLLKEDAMDVIRDALIYDFDNDEFIDSVTKDTSVAQYMQ